MLREYKNSILLIEECLYVHKYMHMSYKNNISESLQLVYDNYMNKLHKLQKLHIFFKKCSSKLKKYEKLCNIPIFKTRKTCSLSWQCLIHTKSLDYLWLLKENCFLCTNKRYLWRLTLLFTICHYFGNNFYVRKSGKLFWSF